MPSIVEPRRLVTEPLTAEAFRRFGDVIDTASAARRFPINQGFAERFDDLARIDVNQANGYPKLSLFRALPRELPMALLVMERHRLGSQAFIPLSPHPYLVVVCSGGDAPDLTTLRCFHVAAGQGVNYAAGTWHHPLLALHAECDFIVIDRGALPGEQDCDEVVVPAGTVWIAG